MGWLGTRGLLLVWAGFGTYMLADHYFDWSNGQWLPYAVVSWVAAIAGIIAWLHRAPGDRAIAGPIAAGLLVNAISDLVSSAGWFPEAHPVVVAASWLWVLCYPLISLAMWRMLAPALEGAGWFDGILDTVTVALVAALLIPVMPFPPVLNHDTHEPQPYVLMFYGVWNAIMFSLVVRTLMVRGLHAWLRSPMQIGVSLWVISDIIILATGHHSIQAMLGDLGFMMGAVLLAASAYDEELTRPARSEQEISPVSAVLVSGLPMLVPPLMLAVADWSNREVQPWSFTLGMSALLLIAYIRVRRLLQLLGRSNADLREARDEALSASRAKSAFLATISHEIRTPMNGIVGLNRLLIDTPLQPEQRHYAEGVQRASGVLMSLIDDILDISQSESGLLTVNRVPMVPGELAEEVMQVVALSAEEKGLELRLTRDPSADRVLLGDPARLRQVLLNLVSNAVKFTDQGGVEVAVRTEQAPALLGDGDAAGPDRTLACFEVIDTGIGISGSQQTRLFEPFVQGDATATRRHGGPGLGLAISRQLLDLMGGTIDFQTEHGRGTSFQVCVPLEETAAAEPTDERGVDRSTSALSGARVLVVEDDPVCQLVSEAMLKRLGHTAVVVSSGEAALELRNEPWDAVLMDCHMPGMSGFETTQAWREQESESVRVPIIAMTASILEEDRRRCAESGMNDFVAKPVVLEELDAALARRLPRAVATS